MTDTPTPRPDFLRWKARLAPILGFAIALGLLATAPLLAIGAMALAILADDPGIAGHGLLGGAVLGAAGGLALLRCLAPDRRA